MSNNDTFSDPARNEFMARANKPLDEALSAITLQKRVLAKLPEVFTRCVFCSFGVYDERAELCVSGISCKEALNAFRSVDTLGLASVGRPYYPTRILPRDLAMSFMSVERLRGNGGRVSAPVYLDGSCYLRAIGRSRSTQCSEVIGWVHAAGVYVRISVITTDNAVRIHVSEAAGKTNLRVWHRDDELKEAWPDALLMEDAPDFGRFCILGKMPLLLAIGEAVHVG